MPSLRLQSAIRRERETMYQARERLLKARRYVYQRRYETRLHDRLFPQQVDDTMRTEYPIFCDELDRILRIMRGQWQTSD
jgi:hypothetical protein